MCFKHYSLALFQGDWWVWSDCMWVTKPAGSLCIRVLVLVPLTVTALLGFLALPQSICKRPDHSTLPSRARGYMGGHMFAERQLALLQLPHWPFGQASIGGATGPTSYY